MRMRPTFKIVSLSCLGLTTNAVTTSYSDLALSVAQKTFMVNKNSINEGTNGGNRIPRMLVRQTARSPKLYPSVQSDELANDDLSKLEAATEEPSVEKECDASFFDCIMNSECSRCFDQMQIHDINWAGVTKNTQCDTVVSTLQKASICQTLGSSQAVFCQTFKACVDFDGYAPDDEGTDVIDCSALKTCDWPGIHKSFIGDGVCQDAYFDTCYNSAVCGYDRGDCCKDTCKVPSHGYTECGSDGFACRDPNSFNCDPTLTLMCPASSYKNKKDDPAMVLPVCTKDQSMYRLVMFDSFGDGWGDETTIVISQTSGAFKGQALSPAYKGGLKTGSEGTVFLCLSLNPSCYGVQMSGGIWGREASWYVKGYAEGAPLIASGGGPMSCEFGVAGGDCNRTCTGTSSHAPGQDPQYRDFKNMLECIKQKCMLQLATCMADPTCAKCFGEDIPDYCFSIESFMAVTDCSMCKCSGVDTNSSVFCQEIHAPGAIVPTPKNGGKSSVEVPCTPAQTLAGSSALMAFSKCMGDFDQTPLMLTDFDLNNFGQLDDFEACAHAYNDRPDHGGLKALDCLQMLVDAMDPNDENTASQPTEVIKQLATLLYTKGEKFCGCANQASKDCPLCPSFFNFKTLIYEAIDACASLDNIDCAAWDEFQEPCRANVRTKFGTVDLSKKEQCDFISNKCGGTAPFPSFRRLDCGVSASWDFYLEFSKQCLGTGNGGSVPVSPTPVSPTKHPTPDHDVDPSNIKPHPAVDPKPDESGGRPSYRSPDEKKRKSHWFRNLVLIGLIGGIAYFIYKRQSDGFSFVRYRRMTNFGAGSSSWGTDGLDGNDMYSGLSLESSTNFEPPSLPPTPMSMSNNGGYGA